MRTALTIALLASAPAFADCDTVTVPEPVVHHVKRVLHNLFHPHARVHYLPPVSKLVCGDPDLQTVTIEAPREPEVSPPPPDSPGTWPGSGQGGGSSYIVSGYTVHVAPPSAPMFEPHHGEPKRPQSVPEPESLWLWGPALAALMLRFRKRRA